MLRSRVHTTAFASAPGPTDTGRGAAAWLLGWDEVPRLTPHEGHSQVPIRVSSAEHLRLRLDPWAALLGGPGVPPTRSREPLAAWHGDWARARGGGVDLTPGPRMLAQGLAKVTSSLNLSTALLDKRTVAPDSGAVRAANNPHHCGCCPCFGSPAFCRSPCPGLLDLQPYDPKPQTPALLGSARLQPTPPPRPPGSPSPASRSLSPGPQCGARQ